LRELAGGEKELIIVTLLSIRTEFRRLVVDLFSEDELFAQAVEGVIGGFGHSAKDIHSYTRGKLIVL
jgi:hypothetical protein